MQTNKKIFAGLFLAAVFALLIPVVSNAQQSYYGKPRYEILCTQNNATLGIINIELYQNIAPRHVRNFDSLVTKLFYDSTAFHRVVPGFVIQGGDPNSRSGPVNTWGYGQPGQPTVKAEFSAAKHLRGTLSAARSSNINSATSQFFICVANTPNLDGAYSVYGRVTSGMNIVDAIVNTPTVSGTQRPVQKVAMFVKFIGVNDTVPLPPTLIAPANDSVNVDTNVVVLKWSAVQGSLIYHVDIARDSLFTDTVKTFETSGLTYSALFLPARNKYYWKVKANNGGFTSESETRHFTTAPKQATVNTSGIVLVDANRKLSVFPNPSKGVFNFSGLKEGSKLSIYSSSGQQLREINVSSHAVTVDMQNYAEGVYFYELHRSGEKISEGRLLLER